MSKYKYSTSHKLYGSFKMMKSRCYCKGDEKYIGPDIKMYHEWIGNYDKFYEWGIQYWFDGCVLTRVDTAKDYCPENCIFISKKESLLKGWEGAQKAITEKYGVEHFSKTQLFKDKCKETSLKRFGLPSPLMSNIVKDKIAATNMSRYGVNSTLRLDEVKEKIKQTNIAKYGHPIATSNPEIYKKMFDTNLKKYGTKYPIQLQHIKDKVINTCMNRYGTPYFRTTNNKTQNIVQKYAEDISNKKFHSDYQILNGKEIDIYNDELKFGIEYCGLRWHCEYKNKNRSSHYFKYKKCLESNVRLITIFEDEWRHRKEQVKNFISSVIGNNTKVHARKCELKQVPITEAKQFINDHHIQGAKKSSIIYFGLYYNNELVGALSLGKHHRNNPTDKTIVLDRLCYKSGITVVGGSKRLFNKCVEWSKQNDYKSIISWSDNRWSNGKVYEVMGFTKEASLKPDYSYVDISTNEYTRISKQSCAKKYINCAVGQSETERMKELNCYKIWDCGKIRWRYSII